MEEIGSEKEEAREKGKEREKKEKAKRKEREKEGEERENRGLDKRGSSPKVQYDGPPLRIVLERSVTASESNSNCVKLE